MNKETLTTRLATELGFTKKTAAEVIDALLVAVTERLKSGGEVNLNGFGSFRVMRREARWARNPRNGERVWVKARNKTIFKPGKTFREQISSAAAETEG